jgi:hypothetical protein
MQNWTEADTTLYVHHVVCCAVLCCSGLAGPALSQPPACPTSFDVNQLQPVNQPGASTANFASAGEASMVHCIYQSVYVWLSWRMLRNRRPSTALTHTHHALHHAPQHVEMVHNPQTPLIGSAANN